MPSPQTLKIVSWNINSVRFRIEIVERFLREVHPKFGQKLDFIERMTQWSEGLTVPTILVGDLNIAPLESDVWSHKQLLNVVSHTAIEVEAMGRLKASNDWVDLGRHFMPPPARLITWWSYRNVARHVADRGRRLDHMWATAAVAATALERTVIEDCRDWLKPSDHVPIMTEVAL